MKKNRARTKKDSGTNKTKSGEFSSFVVGFFIGVLTVWWLASPLLIVWLYLDTGAVDSILEMAKFALICSPVIGVIIGRVMQLQRRRREWEENHLSTKVECEMQDERP